jgi:hypothetical protein
METTTAVNTMELCSVLDATADMEATEIGNEAVESLNSLLSHSPCPRGFALKMEEKKPAKLPTHLLPHSKLFVEKKREVNFCSILAITLFFFFLSSGCTFIP